MSPTLLKFAEREVFRVDSGQLEEKNGLEEYTIKIVKNVIKMIISWIAPNTFEKTSLEILMFI